MSFIKGFDKTASIADTSKKVGKHLVKYRKDYLMSAAAVGSLGTAIGANKKNKQDGEPGFR